MYNTHSIKSISTDNVIDATILEYLVIFYLYVNFKIKSACKILLPTRQKKSDSMFICSANIASLFPFS